MTGEPQEVPMVSKAPVVAAAPPPMMVPTVTPMVVSAQVITIVNFIGNIEPDKHKTFLKDSFCFRVLQKM